MNFFCTFSVHASPSLFAFFTFRPIPGNVALSNWPLIFLSASGAR